MYRSSERLLIIDADGTVIDAFNAIDAAFSYHGMNIGDLDRFQKRHNLFKYLGGFKEFPRNLAKHFGKRVRKELLNTLTEIYRHEVRLFPGMETLLRDLIETPGIRVGMVTRNITHEPESTLASLFLRHNIDIGRLDFVNYLQLTENKATYFKAARERFDVNPALAYACGDEHKDYAAALASGIYPFIVSYGFESYERLTQKFHIPDEVICRQPEGLCGRVRHALNLPEGDS